ncbi:hypothetical protein D3C77_310750 [compost metagenome]
MIISGINHDRRFDLLCDHRVEVLNRVGLIDVGILQVNIDNHSAALDLRAGDFRRLIILFFLDQPLEFPRPGNIRPFPDHNREVGILDINCLDAGYRVCMLAVHFTRFILTHRFDQCGDMLRSRAAAAPGNVKPALFRKGA